MVAYPASQAELRVEISLYVYVSISGNPAPSAQSIRHGNCISCALMVLSNTGGNRLLPFINSV